MNNDEIQKTCNQLVEGILYNIHIPSGATRIDMKCKFCGATKKMYFSMPTEQNECTIWVSCFKCKKFIHESPYMKVKDITKEDLDRIKQIVNLQLSIITSTGGS